MAVRPKIVRLAQIISGSKKDFTEKDPEYYGIECVIRDEVADVLIHMKRRVPYTAEQVAKRCKRPLEEIQPLLDEAYDIGMFDPLFEKSKIKEYILPMWVPGCMEWMVMKDDLVSRYPQIALAFNELSQKELGPQSPMVPIGGAGIGMHVIPVETAIPAETKTASYEELSYWLKKYNKFGVGPCACRRTRRLMGEGCGHLEEDMCIAVGDMAEFMIDTKRCREVSYSEVLELLKKAEDNGLVHQVTNVDGPDRITAVCNCCRCSCFGLRTSQLFGNPNLSRSNFVAKVDQDKCVACGGCVEVCPSNAAKLGQKICSKTPIIQPKVELPSDHEWGPEKWNINYRDSKVNTVPTGTSPCKTNCPAHIAVQGYLKLAALGRYQDALELIKKENPLPAVCGRICNRRCEFECTRGDIDEPIAIDEVKAFIASQELNPKTRFIPKKMHEYGKKIAIIGSGPAGLSCAYYLAIDGYKVTVFEKEEKLGGMLTIGIPSFRLEKNIIDAEIDILKEMGIEFKTGVEVGKDITIQKLREEDYKGFYLAIGAQGGRYAGIPGEDAEGVITGIDFLKRVNLGQDTKLSGRTVVIGGGNVAIDVARTAVREGASEVSMYCLESRDIMPAAVDEIKEAEAENIVINNSWGPKEILAANGKVKGIVFKKCVSVFDTDKWFNPKYDENHTIIVECENILLTIGQKIQWGGLLEGLNVETKKNGTAVADELTYQTGEEDVFVGGDALTGPKFAIDAIAAGKQAAISLHRKAWEGQSLTIGRDRRVYKQLDKSNVVVNEYDRTPRQAASKKAGNAKETFRDMREILTEEQVKKETARCLGCGVSIVDQDICLGCGLCTTKCKFDAISLEKRFDGKMVTAEKMVQTALPYALKRKINIKISKIRGTK